MEISLLQPQLDILFKAEPSMDTRACAYIQICACVQRLIFGHLETRNSVRFQSEAVIKL
jgi:hypothetical protein